MLVDSRYALLGFRGMTACTPNESEVEHLLGIRIGENLRILEKAGRELLGAHARPRRPRHPRQPRDGALRARSADDPYPDLRVGPDCRRHRRRRHRDRHHDAGAGRGATFHEAARLANYAGGLVVMKRGTATVSADELRQAILSDT